MASFVRLPCEDRERRPVAHPPATVATAGWVLLAAILGSSMAGIDGSAVNVALPVLQRDLHAPSGAMQWVIEGYSLFMSALILVGGSLGDRFGRRRMFMLGVLIFAVSSAACAVSLNISELVIARCVQGVGAALMIPESLALITAAFAEKDRGQAIGTWSGYSAITMAIGPLLGGWFVQAFTWRLVFVINLPIAAAILIVCRRFVPESHDPSDDAPVDWIGATVATAGLGLLVLGFINLQNAHGDLISIATVVAGALLMAAFVYVESRSPAPMVPMGIFSSRVFTVANLYTLLLYAGLMGSFFFVPFNLINVQGYTPTAAGAALLPMILLMFLSSRWSGGLVARIGARIPLTLGAIIAALGFVLFAFTGVGGSYWTTFFPAVTVLGIGTSLFVAPLTTTVMNSVDESHAGSASGINNAVSRVAGLLSIAVLGIVLVDSAHAALPAAERGVLLSQTAKAALVSDSLLTGHAPDRTIPPAERRTAQRVVDFAYVAGFRAVMLICAALSLGAAALAFVLLRGPTAAAVPARPVPA